MTDESGVGAGPDGIVAARSAISCLDGARGVLAYRGVDIHELARGASFEETCYLLWHGRLPDRAALADLRSELAAARILPESVLRLTRSLPAPGSSTGSGSPRAQSRGGGMDVLRTLTSALAHHDPDAGDASPKARSRTAVRLVGQIASLVATCGRLGAGGAPLRPHPGLNHAEDFLYLLTGRRPDAQAARALDMVLVLRAEHELDASTLAARVAAAARADIHSAVVAGMSTLNGPPDGGASAGVTRLLVALGEDATPERVEDAIRAGLAKQVEVPGFGHRVYRAEDPRTTHLRELSRELGEKAGHPGWFRVSQQIERIVKAQKGLSANVDFYAASVYQALGIPLELYTPLFAASRVAGWTAHVLEQYADNRPVRLRAEYTGPPHPQPFVPLDRRRP